MELKTRNYTVRMRNSEVIGIAAIDVDLEDRGGRLVYNFLGDTPSDHDRYQTLAFIPFDDVLYITSTT